MNGSGGKYRRREQARLDSQVANVSALTGRALQLAALGRPVDSLRAEREALAIRRELLPLIPAATGPIWPCLTAVSGWLARLQRAGDALPHAHEAVGIERELAAAHPGRDSWRLPTALSSLADVLSRLGRDTEAAEARTQAAARTSA